MRLGDATELSFPIAIENDPIDMASAGVSFPATGLGGVELHMDRRPDWVVRVRDHLDWGFPHSLARDRCGNALARYVSQLLIHKLRRESSALANEACIEPVFCDSLELAK